MLSGGLLEKGAALHKVHSLLFLPFFKSVSVTPSWFELKSAMLVVGNLEKYKVNTITRKIGALFSR
jgi:hypothetical protein